MEENLTLVSPWVNFYKEIEAMFKRDPEVRVTFDNDNRVIKLLVESGDKAKALSKILPGERTFGSVTVKVEIIPANNPNDWDLLKTFNVAFKDNPAFCETRESITPFGTFRYVLFDKNVVQYPNDDIGDANQIHTTLYQEIAKDIFEANGVHFCTRTNEFMRGTYCGTGVF